MFVKQILHCTVVVKYFFYSLLNDTYTLLTFRTIPLFASTWSRRRKEYSFLWQ